MSTSALQAAAADEGAGATLQRLAIGGTKQPAAGAARQAEGVEPTAACGQGQFDAAQARQR